MANDTERLIADTDQLLNHLAIERAVLSGGSWGSSLSFIYAIRRAMRVAGMLLRSVFLANSDAEIFTHGGTAKMYPEAWDRFISLVPEEFHDIAYTYYWRMLLAGAPAEKELYALEWSLYAGSVSSLFPRDMKEMEEEIREEMDKNIAANLIEGYYVLNQFFIPKNYILNHAPHVLNMPITMIHGRCDALCPLSSVLELKKRLITSRLRIVTSGHSKRDPEMQSAILEEAELLYDQINVRL